MSLLWVVLGLLLAFILVIPFTSIRLEARYWRKGADDQLNIQIRLLWGLIRLRYKIPVIKWMENEGSLIIREKSEDQPIKGSWRQRITWHSLRVMRERYLMFRDQVHQLQDLIRSFLRHVVFEHLEWRSSVGTGDAAETGVITGVVWGVKSILVGVLSSYVQWTKQPLLKVDPLFSEAILKTDLHCIIRFRIGHAMLAAIRLMRSMRKGRKGEEQKWQSTLFKA